jgi:hypothetical protein
VGTPLALEMLHNDLRHIDILTSISRQPERDRKKDVIQKVRTCQDISLETFLQLGHLVNKSHVPKPRYQGRNIFLFKSRDPMVYSVEKSELGTLKFLGKIFRCVLQAYEFFSPVKNCNQT